jgi:phosphoserine phosphatase RsbU/P
VNSVLHSVLASAVNATGAEAGWVFAIRGDRLAVVAAIGIDDLVGTEIGSDVGTAGFVVTSGQPMAIAARPDDARLAEGIIGLLPRPPTSMLCVPCSSAEETVGALELVEKVGGGRFTFDDVELVSLLAGIAASAIQAGGNEVRVRSPEELASELRRLASTDAVEYARVVTLIEMILGRG